jgi:N-glycosylase/DNA lyase
MIIVEEIIANSHFYLSAVVSLPKTHRADSCCYYFWMRSLLAPTLFASVRYPSTARTLVFALVVQISHCWPSQLQRARTTVSTMTVVTRRQSQRRPTQRLGHQQQQPQQQQEPLFIPDPAPSSSSSGILEKSLTEALNPKKRQPQPVTPSPKKSIKSKASSRLTKETKIIADSISSLNSDTNDDNDNTTSNTGSLTSANVAAINPSQPFLDLAVGPNELRPSATLTTGQCFNWKAVKAVDSEGSSTPSNIASSPSALKKESAWGSHDATEWVGTLRTLQGDSIVVTIRETPTTTLYRPLTKLPDGLDLAQFLHSYFQLETSLSDLYSDWSEADTRLATIAKCIPGVRIINQDPWECLISFICSSNNNIPRITKMLSAIRQTYGKHLLTFGEDGTRDDGEGSISFYSFPSLEDLSRQATDADLRNICGLGYRSKYIVETTGLLQQLGGESYLHKLRNEQDPSVVQEALCQFCGVGRKVADCVGLFSLQQESAIPVDVHVWNIARRDYDTDGTLLEHVKSLTPSIYQTVGNLFRSRFHSKPGWAHSLLFVAELPSFRPVLPDHLVQDMEAFRVQEQAKKKEAASAKKSRKAEK